MQDQHIPEEEIPQRDPQEGTSGQQKKHSPATNQAINDLNDFTTQLTSKKAGITVEYLASASREDIHTLKLECKTLYDLYEGKSKEITESDVTPDTWTALVNQKKGIETKAKQIDELLKTTRFNIATAHQISLHELYTKLQAEKEKVSSNFLLTATVDELQIKRSEYGSMYSDFLMKYANIKLEDLEPEEKDKVIAEKVWVETAYATIDHSLQTELTQRQTKSAGPDSMKQSSQEQNANLSNIEALKKEIESLRRKNATDKADAEERMRSLEQKVGNLNEKDEIEENPEDIIMIGDPAISTDAADQGAAGIKIGSIEIPVYTGNLEEWESFRDLFEFLVHKSKRLNKTVKFHQLRTHLKGQALDTIRGYQVTGTNYDAAWEDLKKRYDRTDELVDEYIRKFFEVRAIEHKATFSALRAIIDVTNQMLRALPNLGIIVKQWDAIVGLIVCSKLNEELRNDWKQKKGREKLKAITDLLDHLETKAIELQPSQGDRLSQIMKGDNRGRRPKRVVFQVSEQKPEEKRANDKKCLVCKGNHAIWNCYKLKNECAKVRTEIVKSLKLCFKCLLKHQVGLCDESECEYCKGPHHVLLCYKKENEEKRKQNSTQMNHQSNKPKWQPKPSTSKHADWDEEDWDAPETTKKSAKN